MNGPRYIGPGFGRTGTNSLRTALEHLGFGPRDHPAQLPGWQAAADGRPNGWDAPFAGYRAQVDWPGARYWQELSEHYPHAKVILTVRDPDEWFTSVSATILAFFASRGSNPTPYINDLAEMCKQLIDDQVFDGRMTERDHATAVFNAHIAKSHGDHPGGASPRLQLGPGLGTALRLPRS